VSIGELFLSVPSDLVLTRAYPLFWCFCAASADYMSPCHSSVVLSPNGAVAFSCARQHGQLVNCTLDSGALYQTLELSSDAVQPQVASRPRKRSSDLDETMGMMVQVTQSQNWLCHQLMILSPSACRGPPISGTRIAVSSPWACTAHHSVRCDGSPQKADTRGFT